ncbi:hypothetical protein [Vibrio ezurae]|uniref:hypothetical protein n=1 Tax=Vibrio ezurae TaxID=252583 RepID=UPI0004117B16|nr:hypothetical protein [Vibrio ezurae]
MTQTSKRFSLLTNYQQAEAKKRKQFIEKYLAETDPKHFLEPNSWELFCQAHCVEMQIAKPKREEFAKWCFDFRMWQGDLFVLAPQSTNNDHYSTQCANS